MGEKEFRKSRKIKYNDMPEDFKEMIDSILGAVRSGMDERFEYIRKRVVMMMENAYEAGLEARYEKERLENINEEKEKL
jgi:hypothetical protein